MALFLERRDESGQLIARAEFFSGFCRIDPESSDMDFSVEQARQLAKVSGHLPVEKRDWALRIGFDA